MPTARIGDWTTTHANLFRALQTEKVVMFVIMLFGVAVAAFNLVSTLVMVVGEKRAEIAIRVVMELTHQPAVWTRWANAWLSGKDRTMKAARAVADVTAVDAAKLPVVVSAEAAGGGLAIYRVTKVQQPSKVDPKLRASQAQQIAQLGTQSEAATYFDSVRERAGVKQINQVK